MDKKKLERELAESDKVEKEKEPHESRFWRPEWKEDIRTKI